MAQRPTPPNARGARASRVGGVSGVLSFRKTAKHGHREERRAPAPAGAATPPAPAPVAVHPAPAPERRRRSAITNLLPSVPLLPLFHALFIFLHTSRRTKMSSDRNLNLNARKPRIKNVLGSGEVPLGSGSPGLRPCQGAAVSWLSFTCTQTPSRVELRALSSKKKDKKKEPRSELRARKGEQRQNGSGGRDR